MATLINGDGNPAVYAAQDADLLSGAITNNKTVILDVGEKFSADVLSSSVIEVHDGVILTKEGRRIQLDQNAVDLFEFPAGAQGVVSWYYIGYKLEIDEDSHQICSTFVQKMDSEGDTIPEGSFRDGDSEVYISLYHVQQDTLGVLTPTLVLTENMTMIDVLDNLIGSASDLPDPTKTVTKNIDQINSDLTEVGYTNCGSGSYASMFLVKYNKHLSALKVRLALNSDTSIYIPAYSLSAVVAQLPDGAKPSSNIIVTVHGREANLTEVPLSIYIYTSGEVRINNASNVNYYIIDVEADLIFMS